MNLRRIEKIQCYAKPYTGQFQLLSPETKSYFTVLRGHQSEASIQNKNFAYSRSGLYKNRSFYMDSLCKSFDLTSASNFSPFNNSKKQKDMKESSSTTSSKQEQEPPCKKCAKIRNNIKKFFQAKFVTEKSDAETSNTTVADQRHQIQMHIVPHESNSLPVIESHKTSHAALIEAHKLHKAHNAAIFEPQPIPNIYECFGCDELIREPAIRGPPIVSPVCKKIGACPLGEVFKNFPERTKKVIKIDRPRSLGPRKRMVDRELNRETSINETQKTHSR